MNWTSKLARFAIGIYTFCALIGLGYYAFTRPDQLLVIGMLTWLPSVLLIFICFTPVGSIRLGDSPVDRLSWFQWLFAMLKGHVVLFIFSLVVLSGFFGSGPSFVKHPDFISGLATVELYMRWQWGIFPWAVYGFWGICIAYRAYVQKNVPYLYSLIGGVIPPRWEPTIKAFVEMAQFNATSIAIVVVGAGIVLSLSYWLESLFNLSHTTLFLVTISFLSLISMILSIKSRRMKLRRGASSWTLSSLLSACMVLLVGVLMLSAAVNRWLLELHPTLSGAMQCKQCGQHFLEASLSTRFASFFWGWWMIWVPLAGSYIASISQGRTLREVIIGLLCFPLVGWLIIQWMLTGTFSPVFKAKLALLALLLALPFVAWGMLWRMLKKVNNTGFLLSGYMRVPEGVKRSRLRVKEASKIVGISQFGKRILLLMIATLVFQVMLGWYAVQIQMMVAGVVVMIAVYGAIVFVLLRQILRR